MRSMNEDDICISQIEFAVKLNLKHRIPILCEMRKIRSPVISTDCISYFPIGPKTRMSQCTV